MAVGSEGPNSGNPNPGAFDAAPTKRGFETIRLGFVIVGSLTCTTVILSAVDGFRTIDPAVLALVSGTVSGIIGFLAGRKA